MQNRTVVVAAAAAAVLAAMCATPAHAQFRNQGVQLPNVGWLGLGSWDYAINGGPAHQDLGDHGVVNPGWNLVDEPTLGAGYFVAIGYDVWVDVELAVGANTTVLDRGKPAPVLTLAASTGLRYTFLDDGPIRPFAGVAIQLLQLLPLSSTSPLPHNGFLADTPLFIGLRPTVGVEWLFADEQGLALEAGVAGLLVPDADHAIGGLFLPASIVRLSYNVYF